MTRREKAEARRARRRAKARAYVWAERLTPGDWQTVARLVLEQDVRGILAAVANRSVRDAGAL